MHPFDLKSAVLAKHAQHVVLIHFPIALYLTSVMFDFVAPVDKEPHNRSGRLLQPSDCCDLVCASDGDGSYGVALATGRAAAERNPTGPSGSNSTL